MRRNKVDSIRSAHPRVAQLDVRQHPAVSVTSKRSTSKTKWYLAHLLAIGPILNFGLFVHVAIARARTGHVPSPTPLIASIVRLGVPDNARTLDLDAAGSLWHSTGCKNRSLERRVNRAELGRCAGVFYLGLAPP